MFQKKNYKLYFDNKVCDICGKKAILFRLIKDKTYMLCDSKECDFLTRIRNGWHEPIIGKKNERII